MPRITAVTVYCSSSNQLAQPFNDAAAELGRALGEGSTGGGSDGNFTAALGVPTLDRNDSVTA